MFRLPLLPCLLLALAAAHAAEPRVLHVAPDGDDRWSGGPAAPKADRSDGPLATLARARDLLRAQPPSGGALVLLRGGVHRLREPLVLTPADSGTEAAPRVFASYPGEQAILSGTRVVAGPWREVSPGIHAAPVPAQGTRRTVFVDGARATWARYPNTGSLRARGGRGRTVIELPPGTARPGWAADPEASVNIIAELGWYNELVRIAAVGPAGDTIELAGRETQGRILAGNLFHVEGIRSELDAEGEWYLDRAANELLLHRRESPAGRRVEVAVLDRLIEVRGEAGRPVRHLAFRGLGFFGSDHTVDHVAVRTNQDAALHLIHAHAVEVSGCRFEATGGYAVWLHLDSQDNVIQGNEVVRGGAGGVLLTGARFSYTSDQDVYDADPAVQALAPIGNVILGNHIHHGGAVRAYCSGIHLDSRPLPLAHARGNYVGHNHLHDLPRNGIFSFRQQGGNIFERNHIHDVLQRTNDGGAIHLASMNPLAAPTHILENRIYRVGYQGGDTKATLAFGIYPDWFTSRMLIRGNVVTDTRDGGIRLLGGDHARIEDNIVGDDPNAAVVFGAWTTKSVRGIVLRGNTVVNGLGPWVRYYTGGGSTPAERVATEPARHWTSGGNTYWRRGTGGGIQVARDARGNPRPGDRLFTLAELQALGAEAGSVEREPGTASPVNLSTDSRAFGTGAPALAAVTPPTPAEARRRLAALAGTGAFVSYRDAGVTRGPEWADEPTKITEFLAFADLRQATARTAGGVISFPATLPAGEYGVHLLWFGAAAERVPEIEVELVAPGAEPRVVRVDHRREGHKWVAVGSVRLAAPGTALVRVRSGAGGLSAVNAVAWQSRPGPGEDL